MAKEEKEEVMVHVLGTACSVSLYIWEPATLVNRTGPISCMARGEWSQVTPSPLV